MNVFRIKKKSGTYAELLETYGLANLLYNISTSLNEDVDIVITDKDLYYEVSIKLDITNDVLNKLSYFPLFRYVKCEKSDPNIANKVDAYDYLYYKKQKDQKKEAIDKICKELSGKDRLAMRKSKMIEIEVKYPIDVFFDVYSQIITPNNIASFNKLYGNFNANRALFKEIVDQILKYYTSDVYDAKLFNKLLKQRDCNFDEKVTATQLYNPHQGQGVNKLKADGLNRINFKSSWIPETMKISGALSEMTCQLVKVGGSYDLKVFVPAYRQVNYTFKHRLIPDFKKHLKGNTPVKIDILNILSLVQIILQHNEYTGKRRKVKDVVCGLHSVYQKDMGQNKAVINVGFIQVPSYIEIGSKEDNERWIEVIEEQKQIILSMEEEKGAIQGLLMYRNFLSASDIDNFFAFVYWFACYAFNRISKKIYIKLFSIESLNKLYYSMDTHNLKLMEIIQNEGFQAVARAIRNSTVSLQYTPKENRKFEIRYGVAQLLQTKSKSAEDLATYIGEFIALYNAETARNYEKGGNGRRVTVREDELNKFYALLDLYPPYLIGALLASYGFALLKKDISVSKENDDNVDEENL